MTVRAAVEAVVAAHVGETFPACAICVVHQGTALVDAGWGWIDPETRRIPATAETLFDFASLTKLFTASACLSLMSAADLSLDTPLGHVVREFNALSPRPVDGGQDPHSKQRLPTPPEMAGLMIDPARVTFRHLLTHTSGLPPWRDVFNEAGPAPAPPDQPDDVPRPTRWSRALAALARYPFVAQPNGIVRYSDIGLMLLGEATARLHGSGDLDTAIRAQVLIPLEIGPLCFNPVRDARIPRELIAPTEDDPAWRGRRAWGEVHDENACGVGGVAGHAGMFGTARALAAFGVRWLSSDTPFGITAKLKKAATTLQAETNGTRRGLGFALKAETDSMAGDRLSMASYGHSGFTGTTLWIDPKAGLVIAVLTNSVYAGRHSAAYDRTHDFRRALHDAVAEACGL
ncbi:MAG: beta-lactamase family protein [Pleurocapsa minor GSE-CHR-MK-17-07R]|jgi:CubicO group peptidase (beta-lactamase class C family)|nr:beta-lactamase family protein [Pleurocapsa minor GSE-CHR-MK 17-07R]